MGRYDCTSQWSLSGLGIIIIQDIFQGLETFEYDKYGTVNLKISYIKIHCVELIC